MLDAKALLKTEAILATVTVHGQITDLLSKSWTEKGLVLLRFHDQIAFYLYLHKVTEEGGRFANM